MKKIAKRSTAEVLMLLLLLFAFSGPLHSQSIDNIRVSISASGKPLVEVLDDLSGQCGYYFTFDSRLIDSRMPVTMDLRDISIRRAIDTLFRNSDLSYKIIQKNIVVYPEYRKKEIPESDTLVGRIQRLEVHGIITDLESGKPLSYATIAVMDSYYGTISNDEGHFVLRIPDTLSQPILASSYIGYKNQYTPVSFNSGQPVAIKMSRSIVSLQEVIIRYQDPEALLSEAIRKIDENYMDQPAGIQAYYREKVRKEDKCLIFSEAVVEISKASYSSNFTPERSRILKGRKITNVDVSDTVIMKIRAGLNSILQLDIVKHPPIFLSPDFSEVYSLSFSDVVSYNDRLVYVISFEQKEGIQELLFRGDIYLDRESLAILAADFEYDPSRLGREANLFVARKSRDIRIRPLSAQYHVEYSTAGGAYHLSQAKAEVRFRIRRSRQWIASRYDISIEMAVTNIAPGKPPQIKATEQLKSSSVFSDQVFLYDPAFWGDYTTIAPEADLTEALKRIQRSLNEITE